MDEADIFIDVSFFALGFLNEGHAININSGFGSSHSLRSEKELFFYIGCGIQVFNLNARVL